MVNKSGLSKPEQSETSCQSLLGAEKSRIIHESRRSVTRVRVLSGHGCGGKTKPN